MSKVKKGLITLISLISALFLLFGVVLGLPKTTSVFANTYLPTSIFSSGTGGTVSESKKNSELNEGEKAYVQFTFTDGGNVYFRRDLALRWYAEEEITSGETVKKEVKTNYFSMQFAFLDVVFEKFTIAFESGEENISKDAKAINKIVFVPVEAKSDDVPEQVDENENDGNEKPKDKDERVYPTQVKVYVVKADAKEEDEGVLEDRATTILDTKQDILITIDETSCEIGEFNVYIKNVEAPKAETPSTPDDEAEGAAIAVEEPVGKFTNIGGYFLDYRSSSSTTPNTPITFTADIARADDNQRVHMRSLNKQNMVLNKDGRVDDNTPAVLVLNEDLYAFKLGKKFSLSYEAIDVCDDNVTPDREYYMLKTVEGVPYMPNEKKMEDSTEENGPKYSQFNYSRLTTYTYFLPSQDFVPTPEKPNPEEYVSIRFKLNDDTQDTYVYLSWYANENAKKSFDCSGYEEYTDENNMQNVRKFDNRKFEFIKVNRDDDGPVYKYLQAKEGENTFANTTDEKAFGDAVAAYQKALEEKAENTNAGTGAYLYLPSLRGLIESKNAGYRNLKFSIYYRKPHATSESSQTSLSYNALKIEVDKEGWYSMRIVAQDASSNTMQYFDPDGELVTVTGNNVWKIEGIPEFKFYIQYKGATIEDPEEQSLGYRNTKYTFDKFDIIALAGYRTEYTLYRFDAFNAIAAGESEPTYKDFVANAGDYFEKFSRLDEELTDKTQKILREISVYQSDITEDDEAKWNRTDNDYHWDPDSSLSFIPQAVGFYVLKVVVEDGEYLTKPVAAYQVIEVRNPVDRIPGQSQWLKENVVSVVLFSISGVLAIVVVVLFLIKPSEKNVEAVDIEKLKGKKKNKSKK